MFYFITTGCTPLYWASDAGHLSVVEALVAANCDINLADDTGMYKLTRVPQGLCEDLLLRPKADTVCCGQGPQHLRRLKRLFTVEYF